MVSSAVWLCRGPLAARDGPRVAVEVPHLHSRLWCRWGISQPANAGVKHKPSLLLGCRGTDGLPSAVLHVCPVPAVRERAPAAAAVAAQAEQRVLSAAGSDGAASSYQVKQLEEQNARLKEALVR